jgi:hypothetical protein
MLELKKALALKRILWKDASEPSKGGIFYIPGKRLRVSIPDEATWIQWKSDGVKHMPCCIINYLMHDEDSNDVVMELKCPEEGNAVGESVTVESIKTEGVIIWTTLQGQSELVFPVTGTNFVAFKETDFILQGDPHPFEQHLCHLPNHFVEINLYTYSPSFPPQNTKTLGQTVCYDLELKEPSLYTVQVIQNELKHSPLLTVTRQTLGGEFSLSIGMGYQTFDSYGIVMEMCTSGIDTGTITIWCEL